MDIRPSPDARRRADRQMSIQVRMPNDKASEIFDLAHAQTNHPTTRYTQREMQMTRALSKA